MHADLGTHEYPSEAYLSVIADVLDFGKSVSPRSYKTVEIEDAVFSVFQPHGGPIRTHDEERNRVLESYWNAERRLYESGELQADVWVEQASKFWGKLRNPDGTINSNYGYLLTYLRDAPGKWQWGAPITQWEWAYRSLMNDKDTRQAVMHFNRPMHQWEGNKDFPCTMHMQFRIRQGHLNASVVMRSCDLVKGLAYDMPYFCSLLEIMATNTEVPKGSLTLMFHSLHYYLTDVDTLERMIRC